MTTMIVPYRAEHVAAVGQFNQRIRVGGESLQFPETERCAWLPAAPGRRLYQDYFVAVDAGGAVHGGYILKHQDYWIGGKVAEIGDFRLPISEGPIDPDYAQVATDLLFHALRQQRRLYGLGIGGMELPISKFLMAGGWRFVSVPFLFKVVRPARFLQQIAFLRTTVLRRLALGLLAWSGAGALGCAVLQGIRNKRLASRHGVIAEEVPAFGSWADELWLASRDVYKMAAIRDAESLNLLYSESDNKFIRLRVCAGGSPLGWAVVMVTAMENHKHFGSIRLGSLVDAWAAPGDASKVVSAASVYLEAKRVDLIVTNQSHRDWVGGCKSAGFLSGPSNFFLATSPAYTKLLLAEGVKTDELFLTRGDGDGPVHL